MWYMGQCITTYKSKNTNKVIIEVVSDDTVQNLSQLNWIKIQRSDNTLFYFLPLNFCNTICHRIHVYRDCLKHRFIRSIPLREEKG